MDRDQIAHEITHIKNQLYRFASDENLRFLRGRVEQLEQDNHLDNEVRELRDSMTKLQERIEAVENQISQNDQL